MIGSRLSAISSQLRAWDDAGRYSTRGQRLFAYPGTPIIRQRDEWSKLRARRDGNKLLVGEKLG